MFYMTKIKVHSILYLGQSAVSVKPIETIRIRLKCLRTDISSVHAFLDVKIIMLDVKIMLGK